MIKVIDVDKTKCTACHKCISVCPVKFGNNASLDFVGIDPELCIGCGECLLVCPHGARIPLDDTELFYDNHITNGKEFVAVVAPAAAVEFEGKFDNFLGWLRAMGATGIFDVSLGAELTVMSYLHHLKEKKPKTIIAQPCPAIVSFIELFRPQLLKYLAPVDSPMLHTIKMIQNFFPKYKNKQIVVFSPCLAKKREFIATGTNALNVTFINLKKKMESQKTNLSQFKPSYFDGIDAERAVLFSTPGGLMKTVERFIPEATDITRKIEGPNSVYKYLANLEKDIEEGYQPQLIDILNCERGCNGGTGTTTGNYSLDHLESVIAQRSNTQRKKLKTQSSAGIKKYHERLKELWSPELFTRHYTDRSKNFSDVISIPSEETIKEIYKTLLKETDQDLLNCNSCGYGCCERMAIAIHNGKNKKENCIFYVHKNETINHKAKTATINRLSGELEIITDNTQKLISGMKNLTPQIDGEAQLVVRLQTDMIKIRTSLKTLTENMMRGEGALTILIDSAIAGGQTIKETAEIITEIATGSSRMKKLISVIDEVVERTNLLSMNASIEAAHAGESGRGFAVVANEIRKLATKADKSTHEIGASLANSIKKMEISRGMSESSKTVMNEINDNVKIVSDSFSKIDLAVDHLSDANNSYEKELNEVAASMKSVTAESNRLRIQTEQIMNLLVDMISEK